MFHAVPNVRLRNTQPRQVHTAKALRRRIKFARRRFASRESLSLESLEQRELLAADVVFTLPATGAYDLSVQAGEMFLRDEAGNALIQQAINDIASLTINGTAGNDTLRILETADGLPQFVGDTSAGEAFALPSFLNSGFVNVAGNQHVGLHFEAGSGDDVLELVTVNAHTVSYFVGEANPSDATQKRGNLNVADQLTISFDGLTPQVVPGNGGILRVDASSDAATTTLTVRDDPTDLAGAGGMMVTGDGGFETVFFGGFSQLIVIGGDGPETFELLDFDAATSLTSITLDGDNNSGTDVSSDTFVLTSLPTTITANLLGGGGDDVFSIDQTTGFVALGSINFDGGTHEFGDSFQFTGDNVASGTFIPSGAFSDAATFNYGTNFVGLQNIEASLIGGLSAATFVTPNQVDDLVIQEISAGGAPVLTLSGTSDGVQLSAPIFANVPTLTFDTGTNDVTAGADTIVYDNLDAPVGLVQVNLTTGAFADNITLASVAPETAVFVDAGTENDFVQVGTVDFGLNSVLGGVNVLGGDQEAVDEWTDSVTASGATFDIANPVGDTLRVVDFATNVDSVYIISDGAIEAVGLLPFNFGQTETVELITGQANNEIDIESTPAGATVRIQTADRIDTVNIINTGAGSLVDLSTFDGADQVSVVETGAGSFVRLDTGLGRDQVTIENTGGGSGLAAVLGDGADLATVQRSGVTSVVSIQGDAGSDELSLSFAANAFDSANIQVDGGAGDDFLELTPEALIANSLLIGGEGSDALRLVDGSTSPTVYALSSTAITKTIGGVDVSAMFETIEVVQLLTGEAADVITVTPTVGIQYEIDAGDPTEVAGTATGDRLIPRTDGLTNVMIPADVTSGVITADGVGNIVFINVELLPDEDNPPLPDGDRFEINETIATATNLGSEPVVTLRDVSLHSDADVDVYKITAHDTGKLIINTLFANVDGNIDMQIVDSNGTELAIRNSLDDNESAVIPVVSQEDYFIRVFSPTGDINSYTLEVENFAAPVPTSVHLDSASDTGPSNSDGITSNSAPRLLVQADVSNLADMGIAVLDATAANAGQAGAGVIVRLTNSETGAVQNAFANPVGASDQLWELALDVELADGTYLAAASVIVIDGQRPAPAAGDTQLSPAMQFTIDTSVPFTDVPVLVQGFDTGMDDADRVTKQLAFFGSATAMAHVVISANDLVIGTASTGLTGNWVLTSPTLADGEYVFRASIIGLNGLVSASDSSGPIVLDTVAPNIARLVLMSDDGRFPNDLVTSVNRPVVQLSVGDFGGPARPHDVKYRLYLTPAGSASDVLLVDSFAETGDFIEGGNVTRTIALPAGGALPDGTHTLRLEVEDRAGNVTQGVPLTFTIDTSLPPDPPIEGTGPGPRVAAVTFADGRSVFDSKATDGPSPHSNALLVTFVHDVVAGSTASPFNNATMLDPGNYSLVGDATGQVFIESVELIGDTTNNTAVVQLNLAANLPDDRLTLTAYDRILDAAGNRLDGDAHASQPGATATILPSGDGNAGGDFVARLTVDALPEIGTWSGGSVYIDTNGNFRFDPENNDDTNEDIVYTLGFPSDDIFAGNFVAAADGVADGFDKLAAYGDVGISFDARRFRWLVDGNNDGVIEQDVDVNLADGMNVNGLPVAGRFDANDVNGDEVGVFTGRVWWIDTDHDFQLDTQIQSQLRGYPIVGDFDDDGFDDLGTYNEAEDRFEFDLTAGTRGGWDGVLDKSFVFGFAGVRERPVAADFDGDNVDDVGLWVPDRSGQTPVATGEWYILVSQDATLFKRVETEPQMGMEVVQFEPQPFGNDLFAQFGNEFALPIVGNFDPPVTVSSPAAMLALFPMHNSANPFDVDNDGELSPFDALFAINALEDGPTDGVYADTDRDNEISPRDALGVINALNDAAEAAQQAAAAHAIAKAPLSSGAVVSSQSADSISQTSRIGVSTVRSEMGIAETQALATDAVFAEGSVAVDAVDDTNRHRNRWRLPPASTSARPLTADGNAVTDLIELLATDLIRANRR